LQEAQAEGKPAPLASAPAAAIAAVAAVAQKEDLGDGKS